MSNALKGALLSGLVLPGLGQIVLKKYRRGLAFVTAVSVGMALLMVKVYQTAMAIVEKAGPAADSMDLNRMVTSTNQAVAEAGTLGYQLALALIVIAWVFGAVDAYFVGRKLDMGEKSVAPGSGR